MSSEGGSRKQAQRAARGEVRAATEPQLAGSARLGPSVFPERRGRRVDRAERGAMAGACPHNKLWSQSKKSRPQDERPVAQRQFGTVDCDG